MPYTVRETHIEQPTMHGRCAGGSEIHRDPTPEALQFTSRDVSFSLEIQRNHWETSLGQTLMVSTTVMMLHRN